jgi:hypothetical protein
MPRTQEQKNKYLQEWRRRTGRVMGWSTCKVEGCGRRIREDNAHGFCRPHSGRAIAILPHRARSKADRERKLLAELEEVRRKPKPNAAAARLVELATARAAGVKYGYSGPLNPNHR